MLKCDKFRKYLLCCTWYYPIINLFTRAHLTQTFLKHSIITTESALRKPPAKQKKSMKI